MDECHMDRADDTDALGDRGDRAGPSKSLHQIAAVVIVPTKRFPVRRGHKTLEAKLFGFLREPDVSVPGAPEAIRMEREGRAVSVDTENAELDAIFGIANGIRF